MQLKIVSRNIPPDRENTNDRFRVKYGDRKLFTTLQVKIARIATGEVQSFEFSSSALPATDSIHFSTSVSNNKLLVSWKNIQPSGNTETKMKVSEQPTVKPTASIKKEIGKTAFPPIANEKSKILILGTMPGERSLALQQYYGHAGNHFWKIMFTLLKQPFATDYEIRKKLLLDNSIALWDVLKYCESVGSADTDIANEQPNDFEAFFDEHPAITHVFFSSKKAEEFYEEHVRKNENLIFENLPSPSSANTWKTFDDKVNEWKIILKLIDNG